MSLSNINYRILGFFSFLISFLNFILSSELFKNCFRHNAYCDLKPSVVKKSSYFHIKNIKYMIKWHEKSSHNLQKFWYKNGIIMYCWYMGHSEYG